MLDAESEDSFDDDSDWELFNSDGGSDNENDRVQRGSAARTELIKSNLFSREIKRQESVEELSQLLAASRVKSNPDTSAQSLQMKVEEIQENELSHVVPMHHWGVDFGLDYDNSDGDVGLFDDSNHEQLTCDETNQIVRLDDIQCPICKKKVSSTDVITTASNWNDPPTNLKNSNLGCDHVVHQKCWMSWLANKHRSDCDITGSNGHQKQLCKIVPECTICLGEFAPNDVISWAKCGGDPNDAIGGCDHNFHHKCFIAWLQKHDDCPLCRRKVVHEDAEKRFAGWEVR